MVIIILIVWLILGGYYLVQNSDIIAETKDEKKKLLGMVIIAFSAPFYMIVEMFNYMLEQIFGDNWGDEDDGTKMC